MPSQDTTPLDPLEGKDRFPRRRVPVPGAAGTLQSSRSGTPGRGGHPRVSPEFLTCERLLSQSVLRCETAGALRSPRVDRPPTPPASTDTILRASRSLRGPGSAFLSNAAQPARQSRPGVRASPRFCASDPCPQAWQVVAGQPPSSLGGTWDRDSLHFPLSTKGPTRFREKLSEATGLDRVSPMGAVTDDSVRSTACYKLHEGSLAAPITFLSGHAGQHDTSPSLPSSVQSLRMFILVLFVIAREIVNHRP